MNNVELEFTSGIAIVTLNRPKYLNALNGGAIRCLNDVVSQIEQSDARCVILRGSGDKAFAAGADIKELLEIPGGDLAFEYSILGQKVFSRVANLPVPVIAAINGYALGGGAELSLTADIRIANDRAKLGFPEASLGIVPGYGATQRLPQVVGWGKAKRLLFTGAVIGASEALEMGLIDEIAENPLERALELAQQIAKNGKCALAHIKVAVNSQFESKLNFELEASAFAITSQTSDAKTRLGDFMGKSK